MVVRSLVNSLYLPLLIHLVYTLIHPDQVYIYIHIYIYIYIYIHYNYCQHGFTTLQLLITLLLYPDGESLLILLLMVLPHIPCFIIAFKYILHAYQHTYLLDHEMNGFFNADSCFC